MITSPLPCSKVLKAQVSRQRMLSGQVDIPNVEFSNFPRPSAGECSGPGRGPPESKLPLTDEPHTAEAADDL